MNPFGEGASGIPYPPPDIPTPSVAAPDFKTIGQQFAEGQHNQMDQLAAKLELKCGSGAGAEQRTFAQTVSGIWNGDFLFCWLTKAMRWTLGTVVDFFRLTISQLFEVLSLVEEPMNRLYTAVIAGMFGIEPTPLSAGAGGLPTSDKGVALGIAKIITTALHAGAPTEGAGKLAPSDAGATAFLQMAGHMAIEGWLIGLVADSLSVHELEQVGELKEILEQSLGVGRLSRRALAPPMKILVEDPYTALLNKQYEPTPLTPAELVRQYLRNHITSDELYPAMSLHGYAHERVDALIFDQAKILSTPEIVELLAHGTLTSADAILALRRQGYDETTAGLVLGVATRNRRDQWSRKGNEEALSMYRAGKIERTRYDFVVNNSFLADDEKTAWHGYADIIDYSHDVPKLKEPRRASLAEGLQMLERGIWTLPDYEKLLNYYNYIPSDEFDLAQLASEETRDYQTLAAQKLAAEQERAQRKADRLKRAQMMVEVIGVSTREYETLVEEGLRTFPQYRQYLLNKSVAPDNADALVESLVERLAQKLAAAALKSAAADKAKARALDVTQLENAVKQGLLPIQEFTRRMESLGMSATDAGLLTQELQAQIDSAAAKAKVVADHKAAAAVKGVDVSQLERAVRLGLQTIGQYAAFLDSHGYTPESRDLLVSELQAQLAADKATAAKKAAAAQKLSSQQISLSELDRLVRAGVKTTADYQAALAAAGYDAQDQAAMMQFLQLQLEQDQQDLILHGHAAGLVGQLGPSLADLGRAVKLGVLPIAAYQDALNRAGVSSQDQQTLVKNLAAAIKDTRKQQTTSATVSKQVAAAGVSLATLEKDVLNNKLSIEQFQGLLAGYGVPDTQASAVVALVQDMLDNKQALAALVDGANAKAASKGLDLAQDSAAYKADLMTQDDWFTRVESLGYDPADAEILFEILAAQQSAAAAKSAPKKGTP